MQHRSWTCSADRAGRGRSVLRGTSRAVARRRTALSPSWDPGAGLCQVSRRDSRRAGAWSFRTFPPPCHSLAVALMSRKGRTTLYCGAQSVRSSRWNLCARCSRDDMPGGGRSAVLSAKELGLASMAARKARGAPRRLSACLPPDASALACSCHVNPARPRSVGCSRPYWLSRARTCRKSGSSRRESSAKWCRRLLVKSRRLVCAAQV